MAILVETVLKRMAILKHFLASFEIDCMNELYVAYILWYELAAEAPKNVLRQ